MQSNRLLLIEDDFDVAEMLLLYFRAMNYEVLHADTGAGGIQIASQRFPGLILLDVMLPDMDGYDVCLELRRRALTRFIPILFLTQKDERSDKVRGLTLGADDYITKPFDIDELRLRVEGAIRRATRENLQEPRTGLPTGDLVTEEMQRRRGSGGGELHLTLHGFEAYAEVYSFMAANEALYHAGRCIRDVLTEHGTQDDFLGILKETFIVGSYTPDLAALEQRIQQRFADMVKTLYNFVDAGRGGLLLHPGTADERFVPLMHLVRSAGEAV
jgi:DNA-binding response OmpR family regulator